MIIIIIIIIIHDLRYTRFHINDTTKSKKKKELKAYKTMEPSSQDKNDITYLKITTTKDKPSHLSYRYTDDLILLTKKHLRS